MQCSQLHIHVTGRRLRDAAWPNVHLGCKGKVPYLFEELQSTRTKLIQGFRDDAAFTLTVEDD